MVSEAYHEYGLITIHPATESERSAYLRTNQTAIEPLENKDHTKKFLYYRTRIPLDAAIKLLDLEPRYDTDDMVELQPCRNKTSSEQMPVSRFVQRRQKTDNSS